MDSKKIKKIHNELLDTMKRIATTEKMFNDEVSVFHRQSEELMGELKKGDENGDV